MGGSAGICTAVNRIDALNIKAQIDHVAEMRDRVGEQVALQGKPASLLKMMMMMMRGDGSLYGSAWVT